jgi:hypothetical protein
MVALRFQDPFFEQISPAAEKTAYAEVDLRKVFLPALTTAKVKRGPGPRDWKPGGPSPNLEATAANPSRRLVGLFRH